MHRDEALVDENGQVRIRRRSLHVPQPIALFVPEQRGERSRVEVDRIERIVPGHLFISLHPIHPAKMLVSRRRLGGDLFHGRIELIAIGEEQLAFVGGEAEARRLVQETVRDGQKMTDLTAIEIERKDIVALIEDRNAAVRENDQMLAHLVGGLPDCAGFKVQQVVSLVLAVRAGKEHQIARRGEHVLMKIRQAQAVEAARHADDPGAGSGIAPGKVGIVRMLLPDQVDAIRLGGRAAGLRLGEGRGDPEWGEGRRASEGKAGATPGASKEGWHGDSALRGWGSDPGAPSCSEGGKLEADGAIAASR